MSARKTDATAPTWPLIPRAARMRQASAVGVLLPEMMSSPVDNVTLYGHLKFLTIGASTI